MFLLQISVAILLVARAGVQAVSAEADRCTCKFCGGDDTAKAYLGGSDKAVREHDSGTFPVIGDAHLRANATFLVLLAGVGDARCAGTIANIFTRAEHASRMRVGIVDQNRPAESGYDCVATYCDVMAERGFTDCPYLDQIETLRIDAAEARGPAWARAAGAQFVRPDEHDFCLQVDAHTDFARGYDVVLPRMWAQTGNEYAVLSTYVNDVHEGLTHDGRWAARADYEVPILCGVDAGNFHRNSIAAAATCLSRPLLQRTMGAGLTFSKCHFETRVPNDPFLVGIFDGEEFSRMVRAWTHGYDVYAPHRAVVFHDYNDPHYSTGAWESHSGETYANQRISLLMSGKAGALANNRPVRKPHKDIGVYGLGRSRTLAAFEEFSGIRVRASLGGEAPKLCANLKYVPYAHEPGPARRAPLPPLETAIPRVLVKGSDKTAWPDLKFLRKSLKRGAQEFVLTEMKGAAKDKRSISFKTMLKELGVKIPPSRPSYNSTRNFGHTSARLSRTGHVKHSHGVLGASQEETEASQPVMRRLTRSESVE